MEPVAAHVHCDDTMPTKPTTGETPMTAHQAARVKQLAFDAFDAYEPDAFKEVLSQAEAERRIAMLSAKLKLLDTPPHTL
jgi:hypothetical protein